MALIIKGIFPDAKFVITLRNQADQSIRQKITWKQRKDGKNGRKKQSDVLV
jgi:hypothetical protein